MTQPATMQAIAITKPGAPEVLQPVNWPMPVCGPGDVLIRVAAAGVNGPDLAQRRGHYDPPPGASPLPGLEVSGIVEATGEDAGQWQAGDRVMALVNGGGYADYVVVPHGQVLPMPKGWTFTEAAALPETWFTVTQTLVMRAGLEPGMTVLVHGASGGIGGVAFLRQGEAEHAAGGGRHRPIRRLVRIDGPGVLGHGGQGRHRRRQRQADQTGEDLFERASRHGASPPGCVTVGGSLASGKTVARQSDEA